MHYDLAILGAGAAGMMAAVAAAQASLDPRTGTSRLRIAVFEKNPQPGIKVLVCGGGRCNFTNAGSVDFLIEQFGRNGRFLTPALRHMDNTALRQWFADHHVPSHEEHDGKIYPDSNQARSVVNALVHQMRTLGVQIFAGPPHAITAVTRLENPTPPPSHSSPAHFSLTTAHRDSFSAHSVLLAVGGMSYQRMGTTGDGYRIAASLGHSLVTPRPAIVGLLAREDWIKDLQGLAVPHVEARIEVPGPLPRLATGKPTPSVNDMLFTHFGLSGPAILNLSEIVAELLEKFPTVTLRIDFARQLSHDALTALLKSWQQHHGKKLLRKLLARNSPDITITSTNPHATWSDPALRADPALSSRHSETPTSAFPGIPTRLAEKFLELLHIPPNLPAAHLTAPHIHHLVERLKASRFSIHDTRGFKEAMVTAGGIALTQVNPHTYESKIVPHFFITGEVLDLTGPSGGYNLQLAFSTGHLAGTTIASRFLETSSSSPSKPET